jgi:hypothetical protein
MAIDRIILTFPDVSLDTANIYAASLSDELKDVDQSIQVERLKQRPDTMDFGATLVLVLGTAAATEIAKGISQWIGRYKTKVQLSTEAGTLTISDSDPESSAKIIQALSQKA